MAKINKRNDEVNYVDEKKHQRYVSNINFIHDIEEINPLSIKYLKYWKEVKRRCIEGYWFEGKWMPGSLYFYINLWKIRLSKDNNAKSKVIGRPFLRDLEWEKSYVYAEAKGFSGFLEDSETTCHRLIPVVEKMENWREFYNLPPEVFKPNGSFKKYIPAREYLRMTHTTDLGKPLFQNGAKNVIDIQARGGGKSYGMSGLVGHNFTTDGATDYDEYFEGLTNGNRMACETMVGAIDSAYSKDLLTKVQLGFDELVGEQMFQNEAYPSPMKKGYNGSWFSGKQFIEAKVDKMIGGRWKRVGSGSIIYHRSFRDDPFSGNGTRCSLIVLEEVGFFSNLKATLGALKDTTYNGPNKYGVIYMTGTGGDMEGGSSEQAMEIFNNPSGFDCLEFNDIWEQTGSIGYFVPYEATLNEYRDSEGRTDWVKAKNYVDIKRENLRLGKSKKPLYDEMQNNPRVPSEAFLTMNSNIFPVGELKEHLGWLRSNQHDAFVKGQNGELVWEQGEGQVAPRVKWLPDLHGKLTPCWFKMKKEDDATGCIQIWEHPQAVNGQVPYGLYVAGNDPYDQDQSVHTMSLGSTFIYKTFNTEEGIYEWPVAEYTARPATAEQHHENVRKLLTYYNATCLYENERNSLKMHFSNKHSLHLLAKTPTILKSTEGSKVQRGYGTHMTAQIKDELEIYTRDWLMQDAGDGRLNLHKIYSIPLLEEFIYYNKEANFDRIIAIMLTICHRMMNYHTRVSEVVEKNNDFDTFFKRVNKFYN